MTVADDHLTELGPDDFDAWDRESAVRLVEWAETLPRAPEADAVRELRLLQAASRPVVQLISLPLAGMPGVELARDAELVAVAAFERRTVLTNQAAGLNGRSAERNLRILDRVCALIADWPEPGWSEAVRHHVERLGEARRAGRARGERLRAAGRMPDPPPEPSIGYLLCHPADHWFRRARPAISDSTLCETIDQWIAGFAPSYVALVARDWSAEEESADVVLDLGLPEEIPPG